LVQEANTLSYSVRVSFRIHVNELGKMARDLFVMLSLVVLNSARGYIRIPCEHDRYLGNSSPNFPTITNLSNRNITMDFLLYETQKFFWLLYASCVYLFILGTVDVVRGTRLLSLLRHCATSRKSAGPIPDEVITFFN
jgi:hypothetical protein